MEEKFVDVEFAKKIYPRIVRKFIEYGVSYFFRLRKAILVLIQGKTTTCCYYGSLHAESTKVLADTVLFQGNWTIQSRHQFIEHFIRTTSLDRGKLTFM